MPHSRHDLAVVLETPGGLAQSLIRRAANPVAAFLGKIIEKVATLIRSISYGGQMRLAELTNEQRRRPTGA
jgi:hypothetical protein